jgi:hypothetical protein
MITENAFECDATVERFRCVIAHMFDSSPAVGKELGALGVDPSTEKHTNLPGPFSITYKLALKLHLTRICDLSTRGVLLLFRGRSIFSALLAERRLRNSGSDEPHRTAANVLLQASGRDRVADGVAGHNKLNTSILLAPARVVV